MEANHQITASGKPLPAEFLRRMEALLGDDFPAFRDSFTRDLPPSLRVNPLRGTIPWAESIAGFFGKPVPWQSAGFYYGDAAWAGDVRPGKHPLHEAGLYYIQEASAMLPGSLCPPPPGARVLDLCAAPGGKASQLAGALGGEGVLVANEIHRGRAGILSQNMERMGVRNVVVTSAAPDELAGRFPGFFDYIVVDAPCSGEGMFRREADAVTMWSPENVAMCAERQVSILEDAAVMLAPGGYLTYSTCTFAPDEDEGVVMAFLARHPEFAVVASEEPRILEARATGLLDGGHPEWVPSSKETHSSEILQAMRNTYRVLPHHAEGEGHFAALLRKSPDAPVTRMAAETAAITRQTGKRTLRDKTKKGVQNAKSDRKNIHAESTAYALFEEFCREVFGSIPSWVTGTVPCLFGDRLYLAPCALGCETAVDVRARLDGLTVLRTGVCVGTVVATERGRGRLEPDHALAMVAETCTDEDAPGRFAVDYDAAVAYLRGETLPAPGVKGWRIVTYRGLPLGWGKASDGVMKNHYPKGLRWNG